MTGSVLLHDARTPSALQYGMLFALVLRVAHHMSDAGITLADILPSAGEAAPLAARMQAAVDHISAGYRIHDRGPETVFERASGGPELGRWMIDLAAAAVLYTRFLQRIAIAEALKLDAGLQAVWRGEGVAGRRRQHSKTTGGEHSKANRRAAERPERWPSAQVAD
ncbi:MAG: hypothetical protein WDN04_15775 [Rhodospirillales bacterium]